jgi:hypothetical protein
MDSFLIYAYELYKKISQWYYSKNTITYYMITEDGEQVRVFTPTSKPVIGFLTVRNKNCEVQYKFSRNFKLEEFDQPTYKLLSIGFNYRQCQYSLDPKEFAIVGNTLFNPLFNTWLKHKFNIQSITEMCIIDDNANLKYINTLEFEKNKYITN